MEIKQQDFKIKSSCFKMRYWLIVVLSSILNRILKWLIIDVVHIQTNSSATQNVDESILPSVRELINQVESMNRTNAAKSTSEISRMEETRIGRKQHQQQHVMPRSTVRSSEHVKPIRSSTQYTPIQAKFNSTVFQVPPVPAHGRTQSKVTWSPVGH